LTQTVALARLRILVGERSANYWSDTELYACLDAGQNAVIQFGIGLKRKGVRVPYLDPIIARDNIGWTASTQEYTLPTGCLEVLYVDMSGAYTQADGGIATPMPLDELYWKISNAYTLPTRPKPACYITGGNVGFYPIPSASVGATSNIIFYKQPTAVASGQDFTLKGDTHEAILEFGAYYAFNKDNDQRATTHLQNFYNKVSSL
jgi:hypothetical protein